MIPRIPDGEEQDERAGRESARSPRGSAALLTAEASGEALARDTPGKVLRPERWKAGDRHILLGVSHPSDDPTRHRTFEIHASYNVSARGWVARAGEQNHNEQRGAWEAVRAPMERAPVFPTAAACLGHAVSVIVAEVDEQADNEAEISSRDIRAAHSR